MKRNSENDSGHDARRPDSNAGSNELDGLVGLGMKKDALALARRILKTKSASADEFGNALNAILTHADKCKPWAPVVGATYERLPKRAQRPSAIGCWPSTTGMVITRAPAGSSRNDSTVTSG